MKRNLLSLMLFIAPFLAPAQRDSFQVGDTLPALSVPGTLNYKAPALPLQALRGKAVILDFWSPSCISCLEKFPLMDSLQQRFKDSLQVILVNTQSRDSTLRFFAARKKIHKPDVLFITGDTVLSRLFPHVGEPYHVWIDQEGVVRHLVDSYNATVENLANFISGKEQRFVAYRPRQQYVKSLFDARWQEKLRYYSYISQAIRGIQPGSDVGEADTHLTIRNASVVELFLLAYGDGEFGRFSRPGALVLQVADSFRYLRPVDNNRFDAWFEAFCYNYDLQLPKERARVQYRIMQEDLARYFDLQATVRTREVPCFALVRTSGRDKVRSRKGKPRDTFRQDNIREPISDTVRYLYGQPFSVFTARLGGWIEQGLQRPFVDATGIDEPIDMALPGRVIDNLDTAHLGALRAALRRYDLDLVEQPGRIKVLELKERPRHREPE